MHFKSIFWSLICSITFIIWSLILNLSLKEKKLTLEECAPIFWIQRQDLYSAASDYAAAESGGLCVTWTQCHSRPPWGWNMYAWCATMFQGRGSGGLCHCEEDLNGKSWHQRSQLTTRTTTYWTKKPMEKQHRVYVIGFWVTGPIQMFIVWLQLWGRKKCYNTFRRNFSNLAVSF